MYEYRAFGEQLKRLDADGLETDDNAKYSYGGKELDDGTNLYYFNARYYDATIGRFINVDPVQDGSNWYVYCMNNPLNCVDPTGLDSTTPFRIASESAKGIKAKSYDDIVAIYKQQFTADDLMSTINSFRNYIKNEEITATIRSWTFGGLSVVGGGLVGLVNPWAGIAAGGTIESIGLGIGQADTKRLKPYIEMQRQLENFYEFTQQGQNVSYSYKATLSKGFAYGAEDGILSIFFPSYYASKVNWIITANVDGEEFSLNFQLYGLGEIDRLLNNLVDEYKVEYQEIGSWIGLNPYGSTSYTNPSNSRKVPLQED